MPMKICSHVITNFVQFTRGIVYRVVELLQMVHIGNTYLHHQPNLL